VPEILPCSFIYVGIEESGSLFVKNKAICIGSQNGQVNKFNYLGCWLG